jgi:hypothetical protein
MSEMTRALLIAEAGRVSRRRREGTYGGVFLAASTTWVLCRLPLRVKEGWPASKPAEARPSWRAIISGDFVDQVTALGGSREVIRRSVGYFSIYCHVAMNPSRYVFHIYRAI